MRTQISTQLDSAPELAWEAVQTTRLLKYVCAPLILFEAIQPRILPEVWGSGNYFVRMKFLGLISVGDQWVMISYPNREISSKRKEYTIRDNGRSKLVKKWDHWISIIETVDGRSLYTDRVDIEAGFLTPIIWLFSQIFYRHRQRQWQKLVKHKFSFSAVENKQSVT